jgi:hypothetical protein
MKVRDALGAERFVDVNYAALTRAPVSVAMDVLRQIGLSPTADDERRIQAWAVANARDVRSTHHYAPEDFGLSMRQLEMLFADYRGRFTP